MKMIYRLAIGVYQQKISPHKGFRCAYSVEHGGPGCSGAILSILEQNGLFRSWGLIKERFHSCDSAAMERADRKKREGKPSKKPSGPCGFSRSADACGDVGDCVPSGKCDGPCDGPCDISTSLRAIVSGIVRR